MSVSPIRIKEVINLAGHNIPSSSFRSNRFNLPSPKTFSCVVDNPDGTQTLTLSDFMSLANGGSPTFLAMKSEGAIVHGSKPFVVHRTKEMLVALDYKNRKQVNVYQFPMQFEINYWAWLTMPGTSEEETEEVSENDVLGIVSDTGVFTWNLKTNEFHPLFARCAEITPESKITNLEISPNNKWGILTAITIDSTNNSIVGYTQLHSFGNASIAVPAQAAALAKWREDEDKPEITVLISANKPANSTEIQLMMIEAGPQKDANGVPLSGFTKKIISIPLNPAVASSEYPLFIKVHQKLGFVFLFTKMGMLYVYDIATGIQIYQGNVCSRTIFAVTTGRFGKIEEAILGVSTEGQVYGIVVDENTVVSYIKDRLGKHEAAFKLASRTGLRGADQLFVQQFERLFNERNFAFASIVVRKAPAGVLRTPQTLRRFNNCQPLEGEQPPIIIYLKTLLENGGKLTLPEETCELVNRFISIQRVDAIITYLQNGQLLECEQLGDQLMAFCHQQAAMGITTYEELEKRAFGIYNKAGCHDKAILYLVEKNSLELILKYAQRNPEYVPDYPSIISRGLSENTDIESLTAFAKQIIDTYLDPTINEPEKAEAVVPMVIALCDVFVVSENQLGIRKASEILLYACQKYGENGDADLAAPYQTRFFEINLESGNTTVAENVFARNIFTKFDHARIAQKFETAGLYLQAFQLSDNDSECVRIATTYGASTGKPIFPSPGWYADYVASCDRYSEQTNVCVDRFFAVQRSLLECINSEGINIYAQHVALGFVKSVNVAISPDLMVSVVQLFENFGACNFPTHTMTLDGNSYQGGIPNSTGIIGIDSNNNMQNNSSNGVYTYEQNCAIVQNITEALYSFLFSIYASSNDTRIHASLLKTAVTLKDKDEIILKLSRESQYIDGQECFSILTTMTNTRTCNMNTIISALLAISARFRLARELVMCLCQAVNIQQYDNDTCMKFFGTNACLILTEFLTKYSPDQTGVVLRTLLSPECGVLGTISPAALNPTSTSSPVDRVFTIEYLQNLLCDSNVRERCDIHEVVDVCLNESGDKSQICSIIILPMLQVRLNGNDVLTHTSYAKVLIESRSNQAESFLETDNYLDYASIAKFCIFPLVKTTEDGQQITTDCIRRHSSDVQKLCFKASLVGAFREMETEANSSLTNIDEVEVRYNEECLTLLVETAFIAGLYKELAMAFIDHRLSWSPLLLTTDDSISSHFSNTDLVYPVNGRGVQTSLSDHRDALLKCVANMKNLDQLSPKRAFALVSSFMEVSTTEGEENQNTDQSQYINGYLIQILEKMILVPNSQHLHNTSMQNLLLTVTIDSGLNQIPKLQKYIESSDACYDVDIVGTKCVETAVQYAEMNYSFSSYSLYYYCAVNAYTKFERYPEAVKVLLDYISLDEAYKYATERAPENHNVWALIGVAQLDESDKADKVGNVELCADFICRACNSLIHASDSSEAAYKRMITSVFRFARDHGDTEVWADLSSKSFDILVEYLRIIRNLVYQAGNVPAHIEIDTALMYSFARLHRYDDLDTFLQTITTINPNKNQSMLGISTAASMMLSHNIAPNRGNVAEVGERVYLEKNYEAARLLFSAVNNWFMLALTLLKLGDYRNAVDAARKANATRCWREVNAACLLAGEISLAKSAGLHLVIDLKEVRGVCKFYEERGFITELIDLLESGCENPKATNMGVSNCDNIFTILASYYARYMWFITSKSSNPEDSAKRLMHFLRTHYDKIHVLTVIDVCKECHLWDEVVYLYKVSRDYDTAAITMIEHAPVSFDHKSLLRIVNSILSQDLLTRIAEFYILYYPEYLTEFLLVSLFGFYVVFSQNPNATTTDVITGNNKLIRDVTGAANKKKNNEEEEENISNKKSVDPIAIVRLVKKYNVVPLLKEYLTKLCSVLCTDSDQINYTVHKDKEVNDTLAQILFEESNVSELKRFIIAIASNLAQKNMLHEIDNVFGCSELLKRLMDEESEENKNITSGMRTVAILLLSILGKFDEGVDYALKKNFYEEAAECALSSNKRTTCERLLRRVCNEGAKPEIFVIILMKCSTMLRPDIVLELAWRYKLTDYAMPFMILVMRNFSENHEKLAKSVEDVKKEMEEVKKQNEQMNALLQLTANSASSQTTGAGFGNEEWVGDAAW